MNENEMIERYIYEVTRRVPPKTREEIRLELQTLIDDMRTEENITTEEVLQKLGAPSELAKCFRDDNNYLIGPEYYDNYMWVIKIALIGIGISAVVSAIAQGITGMEGMTGIADWTRFFANFVAELFSTAINGACSIIGIVTIIFAVLEYQKVKVSIKPETNWTINELSKNTAPVKTWTPNSLPPVPDKRAVISRGESVFSIIMITVLAALFLFAPQMLGAFHYDDGAVQSFACIFNLNEWNRIAPIFVFCLFVGLIDEIIRLVTGYYCKPVMYSSIICNIIQIAGAIILLKFTPLWNPDFVTQMQTLAGVKKLSDGDLLNYWGTGILDNYLLAFICILSCIEIGISVYKTVRYS